MRKKIAAIYIPGLGDSKARGQDLAIKLLRLFKIEPHYFAFGWADENTFEEKLEQIRLKIEDLSTKGYRVSLIAASAGASAALNTLAIEHKKISSVVLICGKVNNLDKINSSYYTANPNFKLSVDRLPKSLTSLGEKSRAKIMSIRPMRDSVVPPKDTVIRGAKNLQSFTLGHSSTIAHYLTVGLPRVAWWIRKNS